VSPPKPATPTSNRSTRALHRHRRNHAKGRVPSNFGEVGDQVYLVPSDFCDCLYSISSTCNFRRYNFSLTVGLHLRPHGELLDLRGGLRKRVGATVVGANSDRRVKREGGGKGRESISTYACMVPSNCSAVIASLLLIHSFYRQLRSLSAGCLLFCSSIIIRPLPAYRGGGIKQCCELSFRLSHDASSTTVHFSAVVKLTTEHIGLLYRKPTLEVQPNGQ